MASPRVIYGTCDVIVTFSDEAATPHTFEEKISAKDWALTIPEDAVVEFLPGGCRDVGLAPIIRKGGEEGVYGFSVNHQFTEYSSATETTLWDIMHGTGFYESDWETTTPLSNVKTFNIEVKLAAPYAGADVILATWKYCRPTSGGVSFGQENTPFNCNFVSHSTKPASTGVAP